MSDINYKFCNDCGTKHPLHSNFCTSCGVAFNYKDEIEDKNEANSTDVIASVVFGILGLVGLYVPVLGLLFSTFGIIMAARTKEVLAYTLPVFSLILSVLAWVYWARANTAF